MNKNEITIGIVSYYRGDRLRRCIETLKGFNIIVWDNNTTGEELDKIVAIEKDFQNVTIIYSKENFGLPRAFNELMIRSKTDWVLLTVDDMLFDTDWFEIFESILNEKPHLEQIHLNSFNCLAFHKKTIARMGWWDERYRYYPSQEDDDWYLRTVEQLGYSPYVNLPGHVNFPEGYSEYFMSISNKEEDFHSKSNFTYFCNSSHSDKKIIGLSTNTGGEDDAGSRNTSEGSMDRGNNETGIEFHARKWQRVHPNEPGRLICKDSSCYKRKLPELDFYPEIRANWIKTYFGEEVYNEMNGEIK